MLKNKLINVLVLYMVLLSLNIFAKEVPYTLEDRGEVIVMNNKCEILIYTNEIVHPMFGGVGFHIFHHSHNITKDQLEQVIANATIGYIIGYIGRPKLILYQIRKPGSGQQ